MPADSLSRFAIALQSLLDAARNYLQTHQSEDDLGHIQSLFTGVQLTAPPNVTIPPFQRGIWPINRVSFGPASTDGKTWQMWPHFSMLQHGNWMACKRWMSELQGIADAVFHQIELEANLAEMNRMKYQEEEKPAEKSKTKIQKDKRTEARDKWIYEQCCKGVAYDTIARRLSKKNKNWQAITTKQGIFACARKYAERNHLPPPPPRQSPP